MLFFRLAFRNLLRNKRRTFLTLSAMALAVSMLMLALGINDGIIWGIINSATETLLGHITLSHPSYFTQPSIHRTIPQDAAVRRNLLSHPGVKGVCGRISCFALLSCGTEESSLSQAAQLLGIDPAEERNTSRLEQCLVKGSFLKDARGKGILLGEGLSRRLEATIGSSIVLMGQASDGSIAAEEFSVEGLVNTGDTSRDAMLALIGRETLQTAFALENRLHSWIIFVKDPLQARQVAEELGHSNPGVLLTGWQQLIPQIAAILDIWGGIEVFTMFIFYFAVFLVTVNTMNMAFLERVREFAILGAIGLTKIRLGFLIVLEGLLLSGSASLLGGTLGLGLNLLLIHYPIDLSSVLPPISYGGGNLPPQLTCYITSFNTLMPIFSMMLLGCVVAMFPVWRLARLRPVEALRDA